jgi:non-ribosomal peptide synthetase component E (peptide arylation enzyme)
MFETRWDEKAAREFYERGYWSKRTFFDTLSEKARLHPAREAFKDTYRSLTYAQLKNEVERCAEVFRRHGIGKGAVVAVQLANRIEFCVVVYSLELVGAIANNLNPDFRAMEVEYILRFSTAKAYVCANEFKGFNYVPMIKSLQPSLPKLKLIATVDDSTETGVVSIKSELKRAQPISDGTRVRMSPDEVMRMAFTSGTTGNPKGVMHSFNTSLCTNDILSKNLNMTSEDVMLIFMPMGLNAGYLNTMQVIQAGARGVLMERFSPPAALALIQQERVTIMLSPPAGLVMMMQMPDFASYDLKSLRVVLTGGATTSVATLKAFATSVGAKIIDIYGMLESGYHTHTRLDDDFDKVIGSVGRVVEIMGLRIVDEEGRDVAPGEEGEILAYGPSVHLGYFNNATANAEAFLPGGWFRTGDLGVFVDERKNVRISGRRKEIINRGGKKYFPREVEEILFQHPKILNVAVVGVPDERLGEKNCVCVIPKPGASIELDEIVGFLKGKVADYKLPEQLVIRTEFPMTATGKIRRPIMAKEVAQETNR